MTPMSQASDSQTADTGGWENEGGSLDHPHQPILPAGVTRIVTVQYRVGRYLYSNLESALAELSRQQSR